MPARTRESLVGKTGCLVTLKKTNMCFCNCILFKFSILIYSRSVPVSVQFSSCIYIRRSNSLDSQECAVKSRLIIVIIVILLIIVYCFADKTFSKLNKTELN